ncbi:MAG: RNA polymerase sigma factor [Gemmatimonadota bacterium]
MVRYAAGDPEAFRDLYDRWADRVYGFCLRQLGDEAEAADAFQDTFRRLIEARDRYEEQGRFRSWLFTLARRACAERARSRTSRREDSLEEETAATPVAETDDPGRRAADRDQLRRALAELTEGQREALLLSRYEGFTYAEIADMTDSTEAAVKQRVYRALRKLRGEGG